MSDTRQEAERELQTVESSTELEDSLGSALESSFSLPPPPPKPEPTYASVVKDEPAPAPSAPVPGLEAWPETLAGYTAEWQAESKIAREKAKETHDRIEAQRKAEEKEREDKVKAEKKAKAEEEKRRKDEERLRRELGEEVEEEKVQEKEGVHGKVREAWEVVDEKKEKVAETDGRGVTDADVEAGSAHVKGQAPSEPKPASYNPTTSTDPIPPAMQDPTPVTPAPAPTESATLSRHSATSQAWEEISGPSSGSGSGSGEEVSPPRSSGSDDLVNVPSVPKPEAREKNEQSQQPGQPPAQPPSLTLSLFTMPSHLTVSRLFAVLGINLVLPFINGVMLGFGEIFAREVVRVGKAVWYGERSLWSLGRGGATGTGGRGTTGVGLSGGF
ncbi:hypothetical protein IAT38_006441 [Cryptococcus sp. DSM 104549]